MKDFSFTKLRSVYRMRTGNELTDSDFISFELADESGRLTNAGALFAMNLQYAIHACFAHVGTA